MAFASSISHSLSGFSFNALSRDSYATKKTCPYHLSLPQCSPISKMDLICQRGRRKLLTFYTCASVTDGRVPSVQKDLLPKGDTWSVHKFGGTCVGSSQRIQNAVQIIINDVSERKLVVVSAMSKVTDMIYDLVYKAQSRDDSYIAALDAVLEKQRLTALDLLEGDDLGGFLSQLHHDINNLKAMLRAIYIAGHATDSFTDFVVGHGELWSAQMLAYLVRKNGVDCNWMDARDVLIVNPSGSNQVDPDYLESEKRLDKWLLQNPSKIIIATGFIASTPKNIPTTLKRDGSDFSAAIMGALLRASQVTIWTDVDGVYSADPRKGCADS
ncbi:Bifunctional aspartokinase/homoserine dehydrogenase 1, chloroplastic [Sarracenia purpurea var. burkii]